MSGWCPGVRYIQETYSVCEMGILKKYYEEGFTAFLLVYNTGCSASVAAANAHLHGSSCGMQGRVCLMCQRNEAWFCEAVI